MNIQSVLDALRSPYVLLDVKGTIRAISLSDYLAENFELENADFQQLVDSAMEEKKVKFHSVTLQDNSELLVQCNPVMEYGQVVGVLCILGGAFYGDAELDEFRNTSLDLKTIFESSYDVIYVSDGEGVTLRVSSACEEIWGKKPEELVGRSVLDLEKEGIYRPSVTRLVLESREKVRVIQKTKTGRTLLVVGTPVKDKNGKIVRVINASRDITEIGKLREEVQTMKEMMERYKQEISRLRLHESSSSKLIYRSVAMEKVMNQAQKISGFDTTVLITGESGVGKDVVASLIHEWSDRSGQPFVKINCGAIPESLLESELFGYEPGAFTGAQKGGKTGLFELAHLGTLFLDEVAELPLTLQVKLLRVLQEKEIRRIGGLRSIQVDVRLIAATNRNLEKLVEQGAFREDLYYRLNVFPIWIPPLRKRVEDIPLLVHHFAVKFNERYGLNKSFSVEAIAELQKKPWKGNVRELQNLVERLIISSDEPVIRVKDVNHFAAGKEPSPIEIKIHREVPLKEAVGAAEKAILEFAKKKYGTTSGMAKALEVDQSTVSRKLRKYSL